MKCYSCMVSSLQDPGVQESASSGREICQPANRDQTCGHRPAAEHLHHAGWVTVHSVLLHTSQITFEWEGSIFRHPRLRVWCYCMNDSLPFFFWLICSLSDLSFHSLLIALTLFLTHLSCLFLNGLSRPEYTLLVLFGEGEVSNSWSSIITTNVFVRMLKP